MAQADDVILGRIAIQMGLITPGQMQQLLKLSDELQKPVGAILIEQHAMSPVDLQKLIDLRKLSVTGEDPVAPSLEKEMALARAIVKRGVLTGEQADEALRDLVIDGHTQSLGELLVERGKIDREVLTSITSPAPQKQQQKPPPPPPAAPTPAPKPPPQPVEPRSMHCPKCRINFTVRTASGRHVIDCPRCKAALDDGRLTEPAKPVKLVEFTTSVMKKVDPKQPVQLPPPPNTKRALSVTCIICDAAFKAIPDETGRVKCPQCGSSFAAK